MTINSNAIFRYKDYIFWKKVDESLDDEEGLTIRDYVTNYLKEKFPVCRIIGQYFEFNKIDLYVIEEKLPVEIQSTMPAYKNEKEDNVSIANFEKHCKQQIEENIKTLGKCWFFLDAEFLRYLQAGVGHWSSIQFDWLYRLMKEEKLTVFTIDYKGHIKLRNLEDINFISKISTTCSVGENNDRRILERNKYEILIKVLDYHNVLQTELDNLGLEYRNNYKKNQDFKNYAMSTDDDRNVQIGRILTGINSLYDINKIFDGDIIRNHGISDGVHIGIFESEGMHIKGGGNRMRFVDYSDVAQFLPAYLRNKDKWDEFKGKWLTEKQLEGIIKGIVDYNWYKKFENADNNQNQNSQTSSDKEVNVKIEDKDKTITINIKNTKQVDIDDAWGS